MLSLSENNQTDIIEAFNSTSRYLYDLLHIDNPYFEHMVGQIYPTELQLNKANVKVERLFLAVPRGFLQFVIVVFPDHTHYFL